MLKENIRVEGKHDIPTKVMTTRRFALFAEVERDLISERTREGLARARASGAGSSAASFRGADRSSLSDPAVLIQK